jgi:tRNA modification GTPase
VTSGETIVAIATAAGVGGVGIVRLSGHDAVAIAEAVVGARLDDRRVCVGWATGADGARIDQVVAFAMRGPRSFTGEDVAELHGHGGAVNLRSLLAAVTARGARMAEPGEFTRRAVANGKLDVARAEALLDVVHAGSERAWRIAQDNLGGRLGAAAAALEQRVHRVLAEVEGRIDFPDDDLGGEDAAWVDAEATAVADACARLADGFGHGRAVMSGVSVALVGPVNVGKSSLLNALVGRERAIVAAAPGTTRDYLEVSDVWDGVAVTVVDTAGTRDAGAAVDEVERRGIELGAARVAAADVVLVVGDGATARDLGPFGGRALAVRSKCDLDAPDGRAADRSTRAGDRSGESAGVVDGRSADLDAGPARAAATTGGTGSGDTAEVPAGATQSGPRRAGAQGDAPASSEVATSARTGAGIAELRRAVLAKAGVAEREGREDAVVTTARQHAQCVAARDACRAAVTARSTGAVAEIVALELRTAANALAALRGDEVGERVLDEVFARFCIGK